MYNVGTTPDGFKAISDKGNYAPGIFIGIVKDAGDRSQRMGRLKVWIPEFGGVETDQKYWYTVSYASPFAGATDIDDSSRETQQAYGLWMVPPDKGNQVLVCFVNGDTARGYWFACIYQQNMNQMVPAVGAATTTEGKYEPTLEYDKKDKSVNINDPARPRFEPLADGLIEQGLSTNTRRGIANTSARRPEARDGVSRAFGFVTPRGNSIHIDDGETLGGGSEENPDNELIRFRTRSGVGITIHETDGFVFIVSKNGKSFIEVGDSGINFYTEQPMNMRTTGDYNIQSTGDINIDAGGNLNIVADGHVAIGSGKQTYINASTDLIMGSKENSSINSGADLLLTSKGIMGMGAGGKSIRYGSPIIDGVVPPAAPQPIFPERHPAPDGPGGIAEGSTIGSRMPHSQPYEPEGEYLLQTGTANIPESTLARAKLLYAALKKRGYSDVQIAAILGSWMQESKLDPSILEAGGRGPGIGLGQWSFSRRKDLLAFAKKKNIPWDNYETQLAFFDHEMRTTEKSKDRELRQAKTLPEAMRAMQRYERFGVKGRRDQYASSMLNQINAKKLG